MSAPPATGAHADTQYVAFSVITLNYVHRRTTQGCSVVAIQGLEAAPSSHAADLHRVITAAGTKLLRRLDLSLVHCMQLLWTKDTKFIT